MLLVQTTVAAVPVLVQSLRVLRATTSAMKLAEQQIEPCVRPRSATEPVLPDVPKVLPALHLAWSPLMAVLKVMAVQKITSAVVVPAQPAAGHVRCMSRLHLACRRLSFQQPVERAAVVLTPLGMGTEFSAAGSGGCSVSLAALLHLRGGTVLDQAHHHPGLAPVSAAPQVPPRPLHCLSWCMDNPHPPRAGVLLLLSWNVWH